ncbi:MAG TPA: hypothetical protein VFV64_14965 [Permianibacter sp.]|nr:hypothetical protein [Permianibacter sp.]
MSKQILADFLKKLAQDPALMERYKKDPRGVMTKHGVDGKHQDMIMSSDNDGLQRELDGNPDSVPTTTIRSFK